jgi:hypothetical protein
MQNKEGNRNVRGDPQKCPLVRVLLAVLGTRFLACSGPAIDCTADVV